MKASLSYSHCSFVSVGMGDQKCPLCKTIVADGVPHQCSSLDPESPKAPAKRAPRKAAK
jgi:hypothetical protein